MFYISRIYISSTIYSFGQEDFISLRYFACIFQAALTEKHIVKSLASKKDTLSVMIVTKLLSQRGTNALGHFELQYAYDPITLKALKR